MLRRLNSKSRQTAAKREEEAELETQKILPKFLNFLETELWNLPICHFVEQHSIVFDREQGDASMYKNVHEKYVRLVDTLIESYCQDVDIVGKKLVNALKNVIKTPAMSYKEKVLLEPIIAFQDFNVFVPMMMRKNVELQLQAIKMIEHLQELPSSLKLEENDEELWNVLFDEDESERLILISVLKQSKAEWERDQHLNEAEWQRQIEEAKRHSLIGKEALISMREEEQKRLDDAINMNDCFKSLVISNDNDKPSSSSEQQFFARKADITLEEIKKISRQSHYQDEDDNNNDNVKMEKSNKFDYRNLLKDKENKVSEDVVRQRASYLREQRDKLLAKKCKERERQINEATKSTVIERPKTAKAARDSMNEELESRRSIAAKIKANIIHASSPKHANTTFESSK